MDVKLKNYLKEWSDLQHKRRKKRIKKMVIFNNVVVHWNFVDSQGTNEATVQLNGQAITIDFIRDPHLFMIMLQGHQIQNVVDEDNSVRIFFWHGSPFRFDFLSNEVASQFTNLASILMGNESDSGNSTSSSTTNSSASNSSDD